MISLFNGQPLTLTSEPSKVTSGIQVGSSVTLSTPRFEDALDVSPLDDGKNWRVLEDFHYDTDVILSPDYVLGIKPGHVREIITSGDGTRQHPYGCETRIAIPKGFLTDFASIPRPLWFFVGAPAEGKYRKIAVIHDFLYRTPGLCTRSQADSVLMEGMKFSGVNFWTRWQVYLGVRLGGGLSYQGGL